MQFVEQCLKHDRRIIADMPEWKQDGPRGSRKHISLCAEVTGGENDISIAKVQPGSFNRGFCHEAQGNISTDFSCKSNSLAGRDGTIADAVYQQDVKARCRRELQLHESQFGFACNSFRQVAERLVCALYFPGGGIVGSVQHRDDERSCDVIVEVLEHPCEKIFRFIERRYDEDLLVTPLDR